MLLCWKGYAQDLSDEVQIFNVISSKNDTIHFLKIDKDTITSKPTILFCQGSLPIPLLVTDGKNTFIPSLNFDYKKISQKYNLVVISMPHTPVIVDGMKLNDDFEFVPDIDYPQVYDSLYLKNNYLDNYVDRGNTVIQFLKTQKWVDKSKIILAGHSQGANVAINMAANNPDIYAIGYLSGNIDGRFTQYLREERRKANDGLQTQEQAQMNIDRLYSDWKLICADQIDYGDPNHTWKSFSQSFLPVMLQLKMPVYVAYGTQDDIRTEGCDYLPIYFELKGKKNYVIRPFVNCGHNFEEILPNGQSDFEKMHWNDVMEEFIKYVENDDK
ncbi:hypothetical protein FACS189451_04470 [Bacteroidia bacterium]|nr:hypothetical protein FACS189451_04470 [Bacteroidia bacterium]